MTLNKWRQPTALILLLTFSPVFAEITIDDDQGTLTLAADGLSISQVRPRVQLFVGDDPSMLDWIPGEPERVTKEAEKTPLGRTNNTILTWLHDRGFSLEWIISKLPNHHGLTLQCRLTNTSTQDLRICKFFMLDAPVGQFTLAGNAADWMTSSRYLKYAKYYDTIADLQQRGQLVQDRTKAADGKHTRAVPYEEDLCIYTANGQKGLSISAVTDISYIWSHVHVPEAGGLGLDITSDMSGVLLTPGEARLSERVLVLFEPWYEAGLAAVKWIAHSIEPRHTPPVFGWCSWYCAGSSVTQEHCIDVSRYVQVHRDRYPFETLQVDEGWQLGRHSWYVNKKFFMGMTALADVFKEAGGTAGVWMTPISPNTQRIIDGKLWHFGGRGGTSARSFDESWFVGYRKGKPTMGNLDPSVPGVKEYIQGELKRLYDQGYRYFKTDFSMVAREESAYNDPRLTSFQVQRLLYSQMREAIGEDSYLLACNGGPTRVVLGLADATRIGTDTGTKWGFCHATNEYGKPMDVHGAWFPILQIGCASVYTHLIACDPDVTRVDNLGTANYDPRFNGMNPRIPQEKMPVFLSLESVQTFHGIQGLYGGTMMISDLIDKPDYQLNNRLRMVEIMHPVTSEKGWNFGGGSDIYCKQFGFAAERPWGQWISMMVWNPDHKNKQDLTIDLAPTDHIGETFHLWSFWDEQYLGVHDKSYVFKNVSKYHSRLIRLTPVDKQGRITLIGSNLHMAMGSDEIAGLKASVKKINVELVPSAGALEGQLVFYSEKPIEVTKTSGCRAFVMQNTENVYTAVITDRDRKAQQQVLTLETTLELPPSLEQVQKDALLNAQWLAGTMNILK